MTPEQIFDECLKEIQTQGVSVTQHPNGTKILRMKNGQLVIFPYVGKWKLQFSHLGETPTAEAEYAHEEVEKMFLRVLRWGWTYGAKFS